MQPEKRVAILVETEFLKKQPKETSYVKRKRLVLSALEHVFLALSFIVL